MLQIGFIGFLFYTKSKFIKFLFFYSTEWNIFFLIFPFYPVVISKKKKTDFLKIIARKKMYCPNHTLLNTLYTRFRNKIQ